MEILKELKRIPAKIFLRYALLNLPGTVLLLLIVFAAGRYLELPGWFPALPVGAWILKDLILFPFIWRSYDWDRPGISRSMTGSTGIVKQPLSPLGFVQIKGELWKATNVGRRKLVAKGEQVRVVARRGLMVHVVHESEPDPE